MEKKFFNAIYALLFVMIFCFSGCSSSSLSNNGYKAVSYAQQIKNNSDSPYSFVLNDDMIYIKEKDNEQTFEYVYIDCSVDNARKQVIFINGDEYDYNIKVPEGLSSYSSQQEYYRDLQEYQKVSKAKLTLLLGNGTSTVMEYEIIPSDKAKANMY